MSRRLAVLAGIVVSGALFLVSRAAWLHASVPDLAGGASEVDVTGGDAAPAVVALAVVAIAGSLVTAISSRHVRLVTGPLLALAGIGAGIGATRVLLDPAAHATSAIAEATGVSGSGETVTLTPWPLVALAPAVVLVVLGVVVLVAGRAWTRTARFDRAGATPDAAAVAEDTGIDPRADPAKAWDALTRGEDPTHRP